MGKILVVDDMPDALMVIRATLENAEHEVIETGDPRAAVSMALRESPDAIVLDVMMPGISGYEVMNGLRQEPATRKTPILMLSALAGTTDKVRGLREGADDYVTKPFVPMELVARVESLIARQAQDLTGLQGSLDEHPFLEVVQGLEQNRKTGVMEITTTQQSARVKLYGGKVVSAELSRLAGAEALLAMLELSEGNFVFRAARRVETIDNEGDLIPIHPLLLEASWIEDELRVREAHLPPPGQNLELAGELKEVPSELSGLPIREIATRFYLASEMAERFHVASEITLTSLLDAGIAAPNKVRLVVAWLLEQGIATIKAGDSGGGGTPSGEEDLNATRPGIVAEPGAVPRPTARVAEPGEVPPEEDECEAADATGISENLDSAIREFFQEALFRDFSLDDVRLSILIDESAWHSLMPLLLALPASLLGPAGRSARRLVLLDRSGRLGLFHETGMLTLSVETVRPGRATLFPRPDSAGIILWLGAANPLLASPIAEIRSGSSPGAGFLLITTVDATRRKAKEMLREDPRWRVLSGIPESLEDLLIGLCQTEAPAVSAR